jgi:hypothetical protein
VAHYWCPSGARSDNALGTPRASLRHRGCECKALHMALASLPSRGDGYRAGVGRRVDVDYLVSARVIAERLGFKRVQTVHYLLRADETFPEPVFTLSEMARPVRLWYWPDIEKWWRKRQRRQASERAAASAPEEGPSQD